MSAARALVAFRLYAGRISAFFRGRTWSGRGRSGPGIVLAFPPRSRDGYRIVETWDTMGVRTTRADDVLLRGPSSLDLYVAWLVSAWQCRTYVLGIFAWALMGFGNVYFWHCPAALDLDVPTIEGKSLLAVGRTVGYRPEVQHSIAGIVLALDPISPHLDRVAAGDSERVDPAAAYPSRFVSAKYPGS